MNAIEFEIAFYEAIFKWVSGGKVGLDPRGEIEYRPNQGWGWSQAHPDQLEGAETGEYRWKPASNVPYMQAEIDELRGKVAELEANERAYTAFIGARSYQEVADDLKRLSEKYEELIFAVAMKYPGETRHETALRYIRRMEEPATTGMAKMPVIYKNQA